MKTLTDWWHTVKPTPSQRKAFGNWFAEHADDPALDSTLRSLLDNCEPARVSDNRLRHSFADICERLGLRMQRPVLWRTAMASVGAAAAVAVAFGLFFLLSAHNDDTSSAPQWQQVYASARHVQTVTLPDSSTIRLSPGSMLVYDAASFAHNRSLFLHGDAHARISHDEAHPLTLRCDGAVITVHGTVFDVHAFAQDSELEVLLYDGAVTVAGDFAGIADTVALKPGTLVKFDRLTGQVRTLDLPGINAANTADLCFYERSLGDIVNRLERHFDINIVIENKALETKRFYAMFANNESLDDILDALNTRGDLQIVRYDSHTLAIR